MTIKRLGLGAALALGLTGTAHAADMAPAAPSTCGSVTDFATTNCTLSYAGVQLYGIVDLGVGYQTHGAALNSGLVSGVYELVTKSSDHSRMSLVPNGLSQSFIGLKGNEPVFGDVSMVFDVSAGFDPYTLTLADGPKSLADQNGLAASHQTSSGDSSRAGQFYNGTGYAGLSSPTYGTLTAGRQNSLTLDGIVAYDPMGASYAFSPIGVSGVAAGGGDTGNGRYTTSVKYRINAGMFHAAATYQFGGYQQDNSSTGTYEAGFGADVPLPQDYGKLALDAIYKRASNAVSLAPLSAAQNALHPGTLAATISDNTAQMALAKWTDGPLTVSGGYEHILYENPSNPQTAFTSVGGYFVASAEITNNASTIHKQLQIMWIGAKYAVTPKIDVTGAYYHYLQNNYNAAS